jgi:biopolymer transport protein ExbB
MMDSSHKIRGSRLAAPVLFLLLPLAALADGSGSGVLGNRLWDVIDRGGTVMYVILGVSVVGVGFVLDALFRTRRGAILPQSAERELSDPEAAERVEELAGKSSRASVFEVLRVGWRWRGAEPEHRQRAIEEAIDVRLWRLKRSIRPIGIIANTAPLLGLLGTVVGIVQAFDAVARKGALGDPTELADGIAKALLTTCFGLVVAIPMLLAYHYLGGRIESLLRQSEELVKELLITPPAEGGEEG